MTINKSELMKNAWKIAKNTKEYERTGKANLSHGLIWAWKEAKEAIANEVKETYQSHSKSSKSSRYTTLLSIAEKKNLKHGASWYASGFDIDKNQLHPSWENEEICYVYAS